MSAPSGVCVLYVLIWHLMGSAGCRAARLKSQSAGRPRATESTPVICALPGRRSARELGWTSLSLMPPGYAGLNSCRSMACNDREAPGERDPRLAHRVSAARHQRSVSRDAGQGSLSPTRRCRTRAADNPRRSPRDMRRKVPGRQVIPANRLAYRICSRWVRVGHVNSARPGLRASASRQQCGLPPWRGAMDRVRVRAARYGG